MSNAEDPPAIDITQLLQRLEEGDGEAAKELFPIVYDELRQLARLRLSEEKVGHTLQPTALVNEVYLRLIGQRDTVRYASRRGLMVAAAEAMRHILAQSGIFFSWIRFSTCSATRSRPTGDSGVGPSTSPVRKTGIASVCWWRGAGQMRELRRRSTSRSRRCGSIIFQS